MMQFPSKHTAGDINIFSKMSGLAMAHNAINLSQGFPDFPLDEVLAQYLHEGAQNGYNQYAPMTGLPMLRQAISKDFHARYGLNLDADAEITVTPGATYGIYAAFSAILAPLDEVILFEPAYDSYLPNIEMNGAVPVPIPLNTTDFSIDWDRVAQCITPKTRAIIINTPNNPTGATLQPQDWEALASLVANTNIIIISDEVYEQLVFDGQKHHSILQHEALRARSFVVYSFGKVFNNTGWKMGYVVAPPAYTNAFRKVHQFMAFTTNSVCQYALAQYISNVPFGAVTTLMEQKRNLFYKLMQDTPFTLHKPTPGSYFQLASYERISKLPDTEFTEWLTKEKGVATIPISAFYKDRTDNGIIRFCFAKKEDTLMAAASLLRKL